MPAPRLLPPLLALCVSLAACADPGATTVPPASPDAVPIRQASAPGPLHDRLAGENQRLQVRLQVQRDHTAFLGHWFSLRADCGLQDYFRVSLLFPPAHGRVEINTGRFKPNYPVDTYRHDCNAEPRDGIAAIYHPAAGFVGTDTMTLRIAAPSGKSWTTDVVATVQ